MIPLLHPGYHKTGTTWMQRRLFQPEHGFAPLFDHHEIDELILQPGPFSFDAATLRAEADARHARIGKDLTPVISSEIMSGQPYTGGRDCKLVAERLKEAFPEAKVMISIREQLALLPSLYMQYLQAGGTISAKKFFSGRSVMGNFGFDPAFHEYHHLVGHYAGLFGKANVMVYPMELLVRDPITIVTGLNALTGGHTDPQKVDFSNATYGAKEFVVPVIRRINHIRQNDFDHEPMISFGGLGWALYRAVNKFSRSGLGQRVGGKSKPVSALVKSRFLTRYDISNALLQSYVTAGLAELGYRVAR